MTDTGHPQKSSHTSHTMNDPPPPYERPSLGRFHTSNDDIGANAVLRADGRVDIKIDQRSSKIGNFFAGLPKASAGHDEPLTEPPYVPPELGGKPGDTPPPRMNVVIHVVGSRGDVQPFIALGKVLVETYGHRIRLATHAVFKDFVEENGLEFFAIGGDPSELMAFMVKNPGLMPGFESLRSGDVGKRRIGIEQMISGCWRSCFEAGDGSAGPVTDRTVNEWLDQQDHPEMMSEHAHAAFQGRPFVADCIIANPPSFAHIHVAERLGIPLHIMFTMPWSPTKSFPHPLAHIERSNADASVVNYMSYSMIEMLTWQGLGDVINRFRVRELSLEPLSILWAPLTLQRLRIPHTYCWSPALIPKPNDWAQYIHISGFYFLNLATNYTPDPDLAAYLDAGPPPIYIGFGSIVVDDPNAMTKMIFEAVEKTGQRALVSKGWGGIGADSIGIPEGVFMLGNVPHDWLFKKVSCVVHHGGAGTTAAGISAGKPTVIVPFFGDQAFWGQMVSKAGAGPDPILYAELTADKLAAAIKYALKPETLDRANELASKISHENGSQLGAQAFHSELPLRKMRCAIFPDCPAVWRVRRTEVYLSAKAAYILYEQNLLKWDEVVLHRIREFDVDIGPTDPITGGASAIVGTAGAMMMGVADMPLETFKLLFKSSDKTKGEDEKHKTSSSRRSSTTSSATMKVDEVKKHSENTLKPTLSGTSSISTTQDSMHEAPSSSSSSITPKTSSTNKLNMQSTFLTSPLSPILSVNDSDNSDNKTIKSDSASLTLVQSPMSAAGIPPQESQSYVSPNSPRRSMSPSSSSMASRGRHEKRQSSTMADALQAISDPSRSPSRFRHHSVSDRGRKSVSSPANTVGGSAVTDPTESSTSLGLASPTPSSSGHTRNTSASISEKAKGLQEKVEKVQQKAHAKAQDIADQTAPITLDTLYGTAKGPGRIIGAGLRSPLDFTMALTRGFHNMPRLYGEEPRQVDRVTGLRTGLKTAGKEFVIGLADGIGGIVTQPVQGAKKEGGKGFLKGIGRGIAGIVVKPSAAAYALPAYAMMGVYKEIQKHLGQGVAAYIISARIAQGYAEYQEATVEDGLKAREAWEATLHDKLKKHFHRHKSLFKNDHNSNEEKKKKPEKEDKVDKVDEVDKVDDKTSTDIFYLSQVKAFVDKQKEHRRLKNSTTSSSKSQKSKRSNKLTPRASIDSESSRPRNSQDLGYESDPESREFEEAIRLSLRLDEQQNESPTTTPSANQIPKPLLSRTNTASSLLKNTRPNPTNNPPATTTEAKAHTAAEEEEDEEEDTALREALATSLEEMRAADTAHDSHEEALVLALQQSRVDEQSRREEALHGEEMERAIAASLGDGGAGAGAQTGVRDMGKKGKGMGVERAETGKGEGAGGRSRLSGADDDDNYVDDEEELKRALELSRQETEEDLERRRREEIILEHVKRESLATRGQDKEQ